MSDSNLNRAGELVGLQALRAIAATAVAFHHALEASVAAKAGPKSPDWLTTFGASGVDIFFVVSGFIMIFVSFRDGKDPPTWTRFLAKRATRIYPLYWICCAAILALSAAHLLRNDTPGLQDLVGSVILLPTDSRVLGISWTLTYEMYFYLLFAVTLSMRSMIKSALGTTLLIVALMLISNLLPAGTYREFLASPIALEFCMGLLLGLVFLRSGQRFSLPLAACIPGFILLATAPLFVLHPTTGALPGWPRLLTWGLGSMLVVTSFLSISNGGRLLKALVLLGDASYAIYLTHYFVIGVYARLIRSTRLTDFAQPPMILMTTVACVAVGLTAHILVERPLLKKIRRKA